MTSSSRGRRRHRDAIPALVENSSRREQPSTARGVRTRAALVAAARVVFERDGYFGSRLTDISAEANCSTGSFYTYFTSKDEILMAVIEDAQHDMLHPGMPHLEPADSSPAAVIEASNRAYFEAYRRHAKLMLILDQLAASDAEFRELRRRRGKAFADRNARAIKDLQAKGLADKDVDARMAARALSGMVSRMAFYSFAMEENYPLGTLVETTTKLWLNALNMTDDR